MNLIIIGTGLAGYTLVKEIRKINPELNITMITNDDGALYSKPALSTALSKEKSALDLIQSTAQEMEIKYQIKVLTHSNVQAINEEKNQIILDEKILEYDSLVLAIGAQPFRPKLSGNAAQDALSINNLDDYRTYRNRLKDSQKVAIIGPGLIGLEFANDLISQDKEVYVIGPDPYPMSALLPLEAGKYLQSQLSKHKVHWHLDSLPISINKINNQYKIKLNNQDVIYCDLIVSAVGLRANLGLVQNTTIEFDKAILCDQYLQTNLSNIYAIGDCAQIESHYLPFVAPILAGSKALAKTLSGQKTAVQYKASSIVVKTDHCPLVIAKPSTSHYSTTIDSTENGLKILYLDSEKNTLGFILMGQFTKEKLKLNKLLPSLL